MLEQRVPISPEDFQQWWTSDTTKFVLRALKNHREVMKEDLIKGLYDNPEFAMGKASALLEILEMTYEQLMEIVSDK